MIVNIIFLDWKIGKLQKNDYYNLLLFYNLITVYSSPELKER